MPITPRARISAGSAETADQPPRNLKLPVCCRHSALTSTRRPAISSRKGDDSSGVRRTWPLQPRGGGLDHGNVGHAFSLSRNARIAARLSGSSRNGIWARSGTSAKIMSGRRRRISSAVSRDKQVGIRAPDQRQRQPGTGVEQRPEVLRRPLEGGEEGVAQRGIVGDAQALGRLAVVPPHLGQPAVGRHVGEAGRMARHRVGQRGMGRGRRVAPDIVEDPLQPAALDHRARRRSGTGRAAGAWRRPPATCRSARRARCRGSPPARRPGDRAAPAHPAPLAARYRSRPRSSPTAPRPR